MKDLSSGVPSLIRGPRLRIGILLALVASALAISAPPAFGAYLHNTVIGEYGKEGPPATGLGNGCRIGWNAASERLYLYSDTKIYALHRTAPGTVAPVGGGFPVALPGIGSTCGDRDMNVDNSGTSSEGNIFVTPSSPGTIYAYNSSGGALGAPWPITPGSGETCGVATANNGDVFAGFYGGPSIKQYTSAGSAIATFPFGTSICKLEVDQTNNDVFAIGYSDSNLYKLTASSNYATKTNLGNKGNGNPGLAVNGAQGRIYITTGGNVKAYDTSTGGLVETVSVATSAQDVAVDEATDTLFVSGGGVIKEISGAIVPDLTTSAPTGTATLHGHVSPAGGGEVTSCEFEFSTTATYTPATTQTAPCEPTIPPNYSGEQDVSASINAQIVGETLYHYRLVASNANGTNRSADATFTPHFVAQLNTDAATELDRKSAKLNGSFLGTGEDTEYFFEWGTSAPAYGHSTPLSDAGVTNSLTSVSALVANELEPQTTYHYRIVASNSQGTSNGNDATFQTLPAVPGLTTEQPTDVQPNTATLNGSYVATDEDTTYHFEWGGSTSYGHTTTPVGPDHTVSGTQLISTDIVGLVPGNTYHYRAVVSNPVGTTYGNDVTFDAPQIPSIVSQSVTNVTATSADLNTSINPHNSETTYRFDYGVTTSYGQTAPTPEGILSAGEATEPVTVHLSGLTPHTVYHFQVVATNEFGTAESGDLSFNFYPPSCPNQSLRQQSNADSLPDCRAYELVSPEDAGTAVIFSGPTPQSPTAISPSRTTFAAAIGAIPGVGEPANTRGDLYLSTRTSTGWKTKYVGLPASMTQWSGGPPWNIEYNNTYYAQNFGDVMTNPSMSLIGIWDRGYYYCNVNDYATCQTDGSPEGAYGLPDVPKGHSDAPYVVNSTTGAIVDRWPTNVAVVPLGDKFVGHTDASADMSHFIFTSNIPFVPGGLTGSSPPGEAHPGGNPGDMYDNDTTNGTLSIVSLDSAGEHIQAWPVETSDDGSHILMTVGGAKQNGTWAKTSGPGQLFMRVNDAMTYEIAAGQNVQYVDMTPDGSKVYFTSSQDLTSDGSDTDTSKDLYMWSETSNSPNGITLISKNNDPNSGPTDSCSASWTAKCNVGIITFSGFTTSESQYNLQYTDQLGGAGGAAAYENIVAPDNGNIYFVSPEQLDGDYGVPGAENLYDYRGGELQFVVALTPNSPSCVYNQGTPACSRTAVARMEISPDDSHMAFLTSSQVTNYDNAGHSEVYLYTPATGDLRCTSCLPSGEPPTKDVTASHDGRFMTDDGRTFFNTDERLVPQDTNQTADVYEYVDGRPQLITSGTAPSNESFGLATLFSVIGLAGVSADGTDVYFSTTDSLVGQDRNGDNVKIYDARTGGGFAFVAPPPGCVAADECHGASSSAPQDLAAGTRAALGASGNLPAKKKAHKKKSNAKSRSKRRKRHRRHRKHRKAHHGGRRNG